jgi:hypothetical protein
MFLSNYQITELILGTVFFAIFYYIYLWATVPSTYKWWDLIWCTFTIFIILLFKYFYINYNILQAQNISQYNIGNGIY